MNTPNDWKTVARIKDTASERAALWQAVFGGDTAPIKSIIPFRVDLPGHPGSMAYWMDLQAITAEQRARLVASIAEKFGLSVEEVEADLDTAGCPIRADDVIVSSTDQGLLMSMIDDIDGDGDYWEEWDDAPDWNEDDDWEVGL